MKRNNPWLAFLSFAIVAVLAGGAMLAGYLLLRSPVGAEPARIVPGEEYGGVRKPPQPPPPPAPPAPPPGGGIPVESVPPGDRTARDGVLRHLSSLRGGLKDVAEANPEKPAPQETRKFDTEVFLELICNYEILREMRRHNKSTADVENRIAELEKAVSAPGEGRPMEAGVELRAAGDKNHPNPYIEAYAQWYALLAYGLRGKAAPWAKVIEGDKAGGVNPDGAASQLLDRLKERTANWSYDKTGVERIDGSIVTSAFYVLLLLYTHTDWCSAEVGKRLGTPLNTPPANNPLAADSRPFVVMLENCCKFVESCYPNGKPTTTTGLNYRKGGGESRSLVGGKVLYFAAKMAVAYEREQKDEYDAHSRNLYLVIDQLEEQLDKQSRNELKVEEVPIRDSYTYAYVMRALAILMRIAAKDGKEAATGRLSRFANKMIALKKVSGPFKMTEVWSSYYLPLGILQYKNEVESAFVAAGGGT